MTLAYSDFLSTKRVVVKPAGFEPSEPINPMVFVWQADIIRWALRLGRAAMFADCGLGKTPMQLEWARHVCLHTGGNVLILAPLTVARQTVNEGVKFGVKVTLCRSQADVRPGINVTNYDMLSHFDAGSFVGVVLDESDILQSFMGKTKMAIISAFEDTPYKLACTATPAPNDHLELGNHAEFLGVMPSNQMIMRWFTNDPMKAGAYKLKGHAERDFWRWVSTWAVSLSKPSDLGYSDEGFSLPPLEVIPVVVDVDVTKNAEAGHLIRMPEFNATSLHKEMRLTTDARAAKVAELIQTGEAPWIIWCNTDYEADALKKVIPSAIEIRGSESIAAKEAKLADFAAGRIDILLSKPSICGHGLNWQHCQNMAFVGLSYSFKQLYQAIRRSWRFGQTKAVRAYIVLAETEGPVLATIQRKQGDHQIMKDAMVQAMNETGLVAGDQRTKLSEVVEDIVTGDNWTLHMGDNCQTIKTIADDSIHLTVTSPPFENLYIYSDSVADMGNSADSEEFFTHFRYLIKELHRVTVPGRLAVIHCKDLPLYQNRDDASGLRDFPGEIVRHFNECGWTFHSRVTIWKCPVTERERTNNNGLLHKTVKRDTSQVRQGMADYLMVFRKTPRNGSNLSAEPILRPDGFTEYVGPSEYDPRTTDHHPSPYARKKHAAEGTIDIWRRYADPVWWDISQTNVLKDYKKATDAEDERHICPLQLDVIARCVDLWTNPGDLVLDPFNGIGSSGHEAIKLGRRYVGIELKPSYFRQAAKRLGIVERDKKARGRGLFDGLDGMDDDEGDESFAYGNIEEPADFAGELADV